MDFHRFAAGGVEKTAGLDQSSNERRSDEFYEEVTAELFGVLSEAGPPTPCSTIKLGNS